MHHPQAPARPAAWQAWRGIYAAIIHPTADCTRDGTGCRLARTILGTRIHSKKTIRHQAGKTLEDQGKVESAKTGIRTAIAKATTITSDARRNWDLSLVFSSVRANQVTPQMYRPEMAAGRNRSHQSDSGPQFPTVAPKRTFKARQEPITNGPKRVCLAHESYSRIIPAKAKPIGPERAFLPGNQSIPRAMQHPKASMAHPASNAETAEICPAGMGLSGLDRASSDLSHQSLRTIPPA